MINERVDARLVRSTVKVSILKYSGKYDLWNLGLDQSRGYGGHVALATWQNLYLSTLPDFYRGVLARNKNRRFFLIYLRSILLLINL